MRLPGILILLCLLFLANGCGRGRTLPVAYISEHYYGWLRIEYGVAGGPQLDQPGIFHDYSPYFSESGLLRTSSQMKPEGAELYYGTTMEVRPVPAHMIHARVSSLNITKPDGSHFPQTFEIMFIGPSDVYEKHRNQLDRFKQPDGQYVMRTIQDLPRLGSMY
ncbi:MAG TPA: hypothetical protein VE961_27485 [Pyrinomonadaceae bacterium]|nr:hypothetical protein [Pyrinomonadaceae bacterium]